MIELALLAGVAMVVLAVVTVAVTMLKMLLWLVLLPLRLLLHVLLLPLLLVKAIIGGLLSFVVLWASWCGDRLPCRGALPLLAASRSWSARCRSSFVVLPSIWMRSCAPAVHASTANRALSRRSAVHAAC